MATDISATDLKSNSAPHGRASVVLIGSLMMATPRPQNRRAKPTPADLAAAEKLRNWWDERARDRRLTQEVLGEKLGITQGAVSQYLNGQIPLNFRTLLVFARELGIAPEFIRSDLPEQVEATSQNDQGDDLPSQHQRLDINKLADLIETVEGAVADSRRPLPARLKARLIAKLYADDRAFAATPEAIGATLAGILISLEES